MFFILSKVLAFLSEPLTWTFILLLVIYFTNNVKRKKGYVLFALVIFYFFGNSLVVNFINKQWEVPPVNENKIGHFKIGIILGGISYYDTKLKRLHFHRSSDRIFQALDLYHQGIIEKIFISGGAAYISKPYEVEAIFIKEYLMKIGVPDSVIIIESKSKNTYENAKYTKDVLISKKLFHDHENYLLITSGYHMRRALACFKKQNIKVVSYSVDGSSGENKLQLDELLVPNFAAFQYWNILIHEWIGYISYKITGKI